MTEPLPFVSIIVPTRPGQEDIPAVTASRSLDYPADRLEIIIARGSQPAVQRNAALRAAKGSLVYFLDDDSRPQPGNVRRAVAHFQESAHIKMVGGPNICPPDAPWLEHIFAVVLGSWLAFGPSRARYLPVGQTRATSEKELILCNLFAVRESVMDLGGFDESLYPNEENALMDELQKKGARLLYDPDLVVHRRPRPTLKSFIRMLMTYGRGRAEQFRLHPTAGSILNFVPALFCLYLAFLPLTWLVPAVRWWSLVPLVLYLVIVLAQTAVLVMSAGITYGLAALPLIIASHLFYGIGFWRGLITPIRTGSDAHPAPITLDRLSLN